jgi:pyruvate dehydrogenase E2 component (dihydrolipoamide acetyltransferase)
MVVIGVAVLRRVGVFNFDMDRGVEDMFSIIYPPQVAILGFGKVVERPWVVEGKIVAKPVVTATLAGDHRVSDGHRGALLLNEIDRLLQEPEAL